MDQEDNPVRRHLMIAGTGRAGTSFLVRYLTELGLDTSMKRHGEAVAWDENANAGLEELPVRNLFGDQSYVIKSPWLYQIIDDLLADKTFAADAVIIPVRDLVEAATSRSIVERRAVHQNAPWVSDWDQSWEEWGYVPGGNIYSLNPIDQGRLLAVGFHHMVQRLVAADIPVIFLAFPRITEDADYLFDKLRPILPRIVERGIARVAHQRLAEPAKVRIGNEIESETSYLKAPPAKIMRYEADGSLESIAIRRELGRLRKQLADADCATARAEEKTRSELAAAAEEGRLLRVRIEMMENELAEAVATTERISREKTETVEILRKEADQRFHRSQCLTDEISQLRQQAIVDYEQRRKLEMALVMMSSSRSWRLMRPYRATGMLMKRTFSRIVGLNLRLVVDRGVSLAGAALSRFSRATVDR